MKFEITTGPKRVAQKVVIYGVEGIGKSTLASHFPMPLFIDTEGSTNQMNVSRLPKPTSWQMLLDEINHVKEIQNCETLVIDTADWADYLCQEYIIASDTKAKSIEDFGYGKGYVMVREEFGRLLNSLSELVELGINVVLTAHAELKKVEKPDELGQYDHYQLKLSRQAAPLVREWCDMLLFLNYKVTTITDSQTKQKIATGGERIIYTTHHPAWDAKNRFGMPEELPLDFSSIAPAFEVIEKPVQPIAPLEAKQEILPGMAEAMAATAPKVEEAPAQDFSRETQIDPQIDKRLADLMESAEVTEQEVREAMARNGVLPVAVPVKDYPAETLDLIIANWIGIFQSIKANRNF